MNRRARIVRGAVSVGLMILLITIFYGLSFAGEKEKELMRSYVSKTKGILPENLEVGYHKLFRFPLTGHEYYFGKVTDKKGGKSYGVAVDAGGHVVDHEAMQAEEKAAYKAKYGKLNPSLHKTLETAAPGEKVRVSLWLKMGGRSTGMPRLTRSEAEALGKEGISLKRKEHFERAKEIHAEVHSPVLNFLSQRGFQAKGSDIAPLVFTEVPDHVIRELAERDDVDSIDLVVEGGPEAEIEKSISPIGGPEALSGRSTVKANVVEARGITGDGYKVAVIEGDGVSDGNPYLNNATHNVAFYDSVTKNIDAHATAVAGFIASTHGTHRGVAPGIDTILSGNDDWTLTGYQNSVTWANGQGAIAFNNSYYIETDGVMHNSDRWADYVVRNYVHAFIKSAGNRGETDANVTSPGLGYNVLTVGAIDDFDNADWSDDRMAGLSSYNEPAGREKPEVAAVGCAQWDTGDPTTGMVCTTTLSPWTGDVGCGTSYAAPQVTGMIATLAQRDSFLGTWPEVTKAIIIATALHNIEGASGRSEIDGAGAIDMAAADYNAANFWNYGLGVNGNSFTDQKLQVATIKLYAGERFRAALAYDSNPSGDYTSDPLEGDLDLYLFDSSDTLVAASTGVDSWEIIEWTVATTGDYKLVVWNFANSLAPTESTFIGVAWWPGHRVLTVYTPQQVNTYGTVREYFRLQPVMYWNAVGIRPPSESDFDISIFSGSQYDNPVNHIFLEDSTLGGSVVDYMVIDGNHAPLGDYYPEVYRFTGTGTSYLIEGATSTNDIVEGIYGPYTITPSQVNRVWDAWLINGVRKYFAVRPTSGDANLGLALHKSVGATPSTYYQGRSQAVSIADVYGSGSAEFINHQTLENDWLGLVVFNNGATSNTNFYVYADTSAPTGSISINTGTTYTNSTGVTLTLSASDPQTGVYQMRFSNDGSTWSSWEAYGTSKSWAMSAGDGTKTVYVQFKNNAEMVSSNYTDTIVLDTVDPTGTISINTGASYTNTTSVTLTLSASDGGSGVYQMRFANAGYPYSAWEAYSTTKAWTLPSGDGSKQVWVQFSDNAGNTSSYYSDTITLDTVAPTGSIVINGGATYTNTTSVTLTLSATDGGSGVYQMRFSNDGSSWSGWEAYSTTKAWTLTGGDGTKTVYVQYRDNVLNQSGNFTDTIVLDTVVPTGSIVINGGATYTNTTSVTLTLSATDGGSGVYQMRFSNDGSSWSGWEAYSTTKAWTLTGGDGTKTVYVQYRDNVLNQSGNFTDTIVLDTVVPTGSIVINGGATYTNTTSVTLTLSAADGLSGVYQMRFSNDGSSWSGWEAYAVSKAWTLTSSNGTKTVYVQFNDNAGNVSGSFTDTIILDTVAPTGSIVINGGASSTNTTLVTLTLSAADGLSGVYQMRFSNDGSSWSSWEAYGTSKAWTLTSGNGVKTVYVQFKDNALNTSGNFSDTILLSTKSIVDFDGDGSSDLAGLTSVGTIYYTTDLQTWTQIPGVLSQLVVGNFDADGLSDLAGLTSVGTIYYTTDLQTWTQIPGVLNQLVVGDFNGDGDDDIAGLASNGSIWLTTNLSTWTNIPGALVQLVSGNFDSTRVGDELAGLASDGSIWLTTNLSTWTQIPGALDQLVVGDFDGDGTSNLAGLTSVGTIYYTTDLQTWIQISGVLDQLVVGDFDGNGNDDIAGLASNGSIWVTTNLSTWTNIPGALTRLVSGDFDPARIGDELAGLASNGSIWFTTNLITWTQIPGVLSELAE